MGATFIHPWGRLATDLSSAQRCRDPNACQSRADPPVMAVVGAALLLVAERSASHQIDLERSEESALCDFARNGRAGVKVKNYAQKLSR